MASNNEAVYLAVYSTSFDGASPLPRNVMLLKSNIYPQFLNSTTWEIVTSKRANELVDVQSRDDMVYCAVDDTGSFVLLSAPATRETQAATPSTDGIYRGLLYDATRGTGWKNLTTSSDFASNGFAGGIGYMYTLPPPQGSAKGPGPPSFYFVSTKRFNYVRNKQVYFSVLDISTMSFRHLASMVLETEQSNAMYRLGVASNKLIMMLGFTSGIGPTGNTTVHTHDLNSQGPVAGSRGTFEWNQTSELYVAALNVRGGNPKDAHYVHSSTGNGVQQVLEIPVTADTNKTFKSMAVVPAPDNGTPTWAIVSDEKYYYGLQFSSGWEKTGGSGLVFADEEHDHSLPAGAIAGIVIGAVSVLGAIGGGLYWRRRRTKKDKIAEKETGGDGRYGDSTMIPTEVKDGAVVPPGTQSPTLQTNYNQAFMSQDQPYYPHVDPRLLHPESLPALAPTVNNQPASQPRPKVHLKPPSNSNKTSNYRITRDRTS
ncbi:hypothetical protein BGZ73_005025 [Actinomortierella ambigua]|nr:hypothetical protein BGZ73_005025 [Actinomortierella ambigua]